MTMNLVVQGPNASMATLESVLAPARPARTVALGDGALREGERGRGHREAEQRAAEVHGLSPV